MPKFLLSIALLLCSFWLLGCQDQDGVANAEPVAKNRVLSVTCHFAYRDSNQTARFDKQSVTLRLETTDGPVPEIARRTPPKTFEFKHLRVEILHDINSLIVRISDRQTDRLILSQLFQLGPDLKDQFHGGHGFTGLNYVYHPKEECELQYWCEVK